VKSRATRRFWALYRKLPEEVQEQARRAYAQFAVDPGHPSLRFKRVHAEESVYSTRVTRGYRALGLLEGDTVTWFWIGGHDDYDLLLRNL
jgi:hypothetical protein